MKWLILGLTLISTPASAQYYIWATQCALRPNRALSPYCLNAYRNCCYVPPQPQVQPQVQPYVQPYGGTIIIIQR